MQTMDFEQARFNMIEQQVRPWDVLDQSVLDLLFVVKREDFVPPEYRALAFSDMEIPLRIDGVDTGECMWSPKLEARILQEIAIKRHDLVLEIGTGSGYMAALLAHKARQVISVEIDPRLQVFGAANLARAGVHNVRLESGDASRGWPARAPASRRSARPRSSRAANRRSESDLAAPASLSAGSAPKNSRFWQ